MFKLTIRFVLCLVLVTALVVALLRNCFVPQQLVRSHDGDDKFTAARFEKAFSIHEGNIERPITSVADLDGAIVANFQDAPSSDVIRLLRRVKETGHIKELYCFRCDLSHEMEDVLARFEALEHIALFPSFVTGEHWPELKDLKSIDLRSSPITRAGLAKILVSCQKLERLISSEGKIRSAELHAIAPILPKSLSYLSLEDIVGSPDGARAFIAAAKESNPSAHIWLHGDDGWTFETNGK